MVEVQVYADVRNMHIATVACVCIITELNEHNRTQTVSYDIISIPLLQES